VQHIESLNDQIWQVTGVRVRETVPDWVIQQAAEIVAVDVTPEALLNRLKRGAVYDRQLVEKALGGFFIESNLGALRELTLREAAHEVELRQSVYDETSGLQDARVPESRPSEAAGTQPRERILIHITRDPSTAMLIRRGRRVADYLQGDCLALFVHQTPQFSDLPGAEREAVEKHLHFARNLQIETRLLKGHDIAETVVEFAHRNQVTQIFVARSQARLWERLLRGNFVEDIVRMARDLQITVVADRSRRPAS
jgi:two-component system, OmpR family, sensor histidine kinase KdpD